MTREELAKAIREDYERKGVWACKSNTINMQLDFEMLGIILEALEQEPFINKPCISSGVCEHDKQIVLDKIRAEIEDLTYYCCEVHPRNVIDDVLEIIDKYKAESEE